MNRLPPEIIALCVAFVPRTDPRPVVSLTHVCRYWRGAIISSPGNWSSINSRWKRLVPLCLERSGATPLITNIKISHIQDDDDVLQALLPRVSRTSHLALTGFSSVKDVANILPGLFASPMPNLASLALEQNEDSTQLFPSNTARVPPLLQNVSKLKSLRLTRVPLYPALFGIESLVELKLVHYRLPLRKLIRFLESNLNVEILDLDIEFSKIPRQTTPGRQGSLPRLQRLALSCKKGIDSRALFSSLSLPHGANIEVHYDPPRWSPDELTSFLPCTLPTIQDLLDPITTIKYHSRSSWGLHLFGNDGSFSFRVDGGVKRKTYEEFDLFATGAVREFQIHPGNQARLSWVLEQLPGLEALVIFQAELSLGFFSALAEEPVLCPSLNTIAFLDCEVTHEAVLGLESIMTKREQSTAARLHRVVIVNNSQLPGREQISQLRKFVPRVDIMAGDELPELL